MVMSVSYDGETVAGTKLDSSNEGIKVTGVDKSGEEHEISGWSVEDAKTLEMDSSATVTASAACSVAACSLVLSGLSAVTEVVSGTSFVDVS